MTGRGPMVQEDGVYDANSYGATNATIRPPVAASEASVNSLDASGDVVRLKVAASSQLTSTLPAQQDVAQDAPIALAPKSGSARGSSALSSNAPSTRVTQVHSLSAASSPARSAADRPMLQQPRSGSSVATVASDFRTSTNPLTLCEWHASPRTIGASTSTTGEELVEPSADGTTSASSGGGADVRPAQPTLRSSAGSALTGSTTACADVTARSYIPEPRDSRSVGPARGRSHSMPRRSGGSNRGGRGTAGRGGSVVHVHTPSRLGGSTFVRGAGRRAAGARGGRPVGESVHSPGRSRSPPPRAPAAEPHSASRALSQLEDEADDFLMLSSRPQGAVPAGAGDSLDDALNCTLAGDANSVPLRTQSLGGRAGRRGLHDSLHSTASVGGNTLQREQAAKLQAVYEATPVLRRAHPFFAMFGRSWSSSQPPETMLPIQTFPPREPGHERSRSGGGSRLGVGASGSFAQAVSSVLRQAENAASDAASSDASGEALEEQDTVASWTPPRTASVPAPRELIAEEFHASLDEPPVASEDKAANAAPSVYAAAAGAAPEQRPRSGSTARTATLPQTQSARASQPAQHVQPGTSASQAPSARVGASTAALSTQRLDERTAALARIAQGTSGAVGRNAVKFYSGRPDFATVFADAAAEARQLGESRVAVFVCGNKRVVKQCLKHCNPTSGGVTFDCHYEAFSFC